MPLLAPERNYYVRADLAWSCAQPPPRARARWVGWPSELTPSFVNFSPPSIASILLVALLGAGPGSYFDLTTFTFQFPLNTSAANAPLATKQNRIVPKTNILRFIVPSFVKLR